MTCHDVYTEPVQESLVNFGIDGNGSLYVTTAQGVKYVLVLIDGVLVARKE